MFRLLLGGLERLEALDELPPERLERRVPIEAGESPHLEDGVAEVPVEDVNLDSLFRLARQLIKRRDDRLLEERRRRQR